MFDEMISRSRARVVRLASQASAAVLLTGAGLLAAVGAPFVASPKAEPISAEQVVAKAEKLEADLAAAKPPPEASDELPPDWEAIEYSLSMVKNAPKPKKPDEPPADTGDEDPAPVASKAQTRFLGTVTVGNRRLALLSAGGGQRILGADQSATLPLGQGEQGQPPSVRVTRVEADAVWLEENGVEYKIDRAPRTGFSVSQGSVPSAAPAAPKTTARPNDAEPAIAAADKPLNPDDYRRDDGTIDYEALRAAARERARARQELRQKQREENGRD
ncbi:MAG: hypothetical protein H6810_07965 [Phycisphaeraceae bacterium]|nr:MAG: hypothetical protein H6810_07965 [Phycisphaeraceae bacterium]